MTTRNSALSIKTARGQSGAVGSLMQLVTRCKQTGIARTLAVALPLAMAAPAVWAEGPELFVADPALLNDFTESLPEWGETDGFTYAIIQGLAILQGDMILGPVDANGTLINKSLLRSLQANKTQPPVGTRGLGINGGFERWPDGIVPYELDQRLGQLQRDRVQEAIRHWMTRSRISFVLRTEENQQLYPNYVNFVDSGSCASWVGMIGGEQPVMVSEACPLGSVIHEIGHAIGLFHEHTRPDRDNFITVLEDNISESKRINFDILTSGVDTYSEYDYGSIMHYGEHFFSINSEPTILVPDGVEIGQRVALSDDDASAVDRMYATDIALASPEARARSTDMEIMVTINNVGTLGANELQLDMQLPEGSNWLAISENSGWQCAHNNATLHCLRDTLIEQQTSQFTVVTDADMSLFSQLEMKLDARTLDKDRSNNGFSDGQLQNLAEGSIGDVPELGQAIAAATAVTDDTVTSNTTADTTSNRSSAEGGGGSLGIGLFLLFGAALRRLVSRGKNSNTE